MTLRINDLLTGMFRAVGIKLVDLKLNMEMHGIKTLKKKKLF